MPVIGQVIMVGLLSALMTGCGVDCSTRTNIAFAAGGVRDATGAELAAVDASVIEDPALPERWSLRVSITAKQGSAGAPLKGHLTGGRLLYPSGEILHEIPLVSPVLTVENVASLQILLPDAASYERIRDALLTGRTKLVLETDLPGRERLEAILGESRYEPARQRTCPYT